MPIEDRKAETPLEKAKRLKAEKEERDRSKFEASAAAEATAAAREEQLNSLNGQKADLENALREIDIRIEASRGEAHETRGTMREAGLDQDPEFAGDYKATVSEVAGNLNELRNERNRIKSELEQINFNIENIDVVAAVQEGENEVKGSLETVDRENLETVDQIKNYPNAELSDINSAAEITTATGADATKVAARATAETAAVVDPEPGADQEVSDRQSEQTEEAALFAEFDAMDVFVEEKEKGGDTRQARDIGREFLGISDEDYKKDPAAQERLDRIYEVPRYRMTKDIYCTGDITFDKFYARKKDIVQAIINTNRINRTLEDLERAKKETAGVFDGKYKLDNLSEQDKREIKTKVQTADFNNLQDLDHLETLLDNHVIDSQDIVKCIRQRAAKHKMSAFNSLTGLPDSLLNKLDLRKDFKEEAEEEIKQPLPDLHTPGDIGHTAMHKVTAAEILYGKQAGELNGKVFNHINNVVNDLAAKNDPADIATFFSGTKYMQWLISRPEINQPAMKKLFNKYLDYLKQNSGALEHGGIHKAWLAKQQGYISEEEFKKIYPEKIKL
ncbi:MAG: hypothetical protein WC453_03590 [Patescibacteria group bacterium]